MAKSTISLTIPIELIEEIKQYRIKNPMFNLSAFVADSLQKELMMEKVSDTVTREDLFQRLIDRSKKGEEINMSDLDWVRYHFPKRLNELLEVRRIARSKKK